MSDLVETSPVVGAPARSFPLPVTSPVAAFERCFATAVGADHAVALATWTPAAQWSLAVAGVGPGDDVVVSSAAPDVIPDAVRHVGSRAVFADVDMADGNLTVETLAAAVTTSTRAVVVVHQAGVPADLDRLRPWCRDRDLVLVEDASRALGSTHLGRPVGTGARIAVWSPDVGFSIPSGPGGVVTTDDSAWAARVRRWRDDAERPGSAGRRPTAFPPRGEHRGATVDHHPTDQQATSGTHQLARVPELVARRRDIGMRYRRGLRSTPGVRPVREPDWGESNGQSFWVELTAAYPLTRDELLHRLTDAGITARCGLVLADVPPAHGGHPPGRLTHARWLAANTVTLPVSDDLTVDQQAHVIETVHRPSVVGRR